MVHTDMMQNSWRAYRSLLVKRRAERLARRAVVSRAAWVVAGALAGWFVIAPALMLAVWGA